MDIQNLIDVMKKLRDPETGCPWDLKQNYQTIVPYTIEEAYEVADAIERSDFNELKLELGDLLFQVVFYAQLADEENRFNFSDVVEGIVEKMIRRHPHVFGDTKYNDDVEFARAWEQAKRDEKDAGGDTTSDTKASVLDGLTHALPALKLAQKIQSKVSKHGFDWDSIDPVYEKIEEELGEVKEAAQHQIHDRIEDEVGDLLFAVVNLSRHLGVDAEQACRRSSAKFEQRFRAVEKNVVEAGLTLSECSETQLIQQWEAVKQQQEE